VTDAVIYPFSVVMNMDKWNSLPKDVQKVMEGMAREHSEWTGSYMDNHIIESIEWSKKTQGVEVITLSKAEKAKWDKLLDPILADWVAATNKKGYPADQIAADIRALMKKNQ